MKYLSFVAIGFAALAIAPSGSKADTIFDVEHARANYRAGLANEDDYEYLDRWGRPSGYYPQYYRDYNYWYPRRRVLIRERNWRLRNW